MQLSCEFKHAPVEVRPVSSSQQPRTLGREVECLMPPVPTSTWSRNAICSISCPIAPPSRTLHPSSISRDCVVFQNKTLNIQQYFKIQAPTCPRSSDFACNLKHTMFSSMA